MQNFDDNELKNLFQAHKMEISDSGFSEKVFRSLPSSSNFYTASYAIWTLAVLLVLAVLFKLCNFAENLPLAVRYLSENFAKYLTLFFQNPKIYASVFLAVIIACFSLLKVRRGAFY